MVSRFKKGSFYQPRATRWLAVVMLLALFALYTHQLDGQSIWRDEALSIGRARQPVTQIFRNQNVLEDVISPDLHPPLYFLTLAGWRQLAGESEFAYRFPSTLAALLLAPLFMAVGRRIWGAPTGLWAALLAGLSPFYFWYAQEARMYSLLAAESLLLLFTLWPLLHEDAPRGAYLRFGAAALLAVYTHYTAVFLIGFALIAIMLHRLRRQTILQLAGAGLLLALVAIPLLPHLEQLLTAAPFFAFSRRPPLRMLHEGVNTFSLGSTIPMSDAGWRMVWLGGIALAGAIACAVIPSGKRKALTIGVGGFVIILTLFYAAAWLQANYSNPRHLTILSVFWFLLLGHGVATLQRLSRPLAGAVAAVTFLVMGAALWTAVTDPPLIRDDVRAVTDYIQERALPGDFIIWHDAAMMITFDYYAGQKDLETPYRALPRFGFADQNAILDTARALMEQHERIWFVHQPAPTYFRNQQLTNLFDSRWMRADSTSFPASWSSLGLRLYHPPLSWESLPAAALATDLRQGPYQMKGVQLDLDTAASGAWAKLYWRVNDTAVSPPPTICLNVRDADNTLWAGNCTSLALPPEPTPLDQFVQQLWLSLPAGLAPTPHQVELTLDDRPQTGGSNAGAVIAGTVTPPPHPATGSEGSDHVQFDNGLTLLATDLLDDQFRSGLWLNGSLLWRVEQPLPDTPRVQYRLVDLFGREIAQRDEPLGSSDYRAAAWEANSLVRTDLALRLPYHQTGFYRLQIAVDEEDEQDAPQWHTIKWTSIVGWPYQSELPAEATIPSAQIRLGDDAIELAGYRLARENDTLTVDLYWRALEVRDASYGIFVHVGNRNAPPLAQNSFVDALRPVSSWRQGEIIKTEHVVTLPPTVMTADDPGVIIGMYEAGDPNLRAPMTANGEPVETASWQIAPLPPQ